MIDCDFPIFLNDNSQNEGRTQHRRSAKKLHQPVVIRIEAWSGSKERHNIRNRRPRRSRTECRHPCPAEPTPLPISLDKGNTYSVNDIGNGP